MRRSLSLRARLILGVIVLAAVGLVAADFATYSALRSFLIDRTDTSLDAAHLGRRRAVPRIIPGEARGDTASRQGAPPFDGPGIGQLTAAAPGEYTAHGSTGPSSAQLDAAIPRSVASPAPQLPTKITLRPAPGERVVYFTVPAKAGVTLSRARVDRPQAKNYVLVVASR